MITTKMFSQMTDQEVVDFIMSNPVSGGCGTQSATKAAAAQQTAFNATLLSQGAQVFGADNSVFNDLMSSYKTTVAAGPSQQGWGAAETNAVNSQIINNAAVANRNIAASVGNNTSAIGGGNVGGGTAAGSTSALEASVAESVEGQKSAALNQATQQNYQQGVQNYQFAATGMEKAPSVYTNMPGMNQTTQSGLNQGMANAQAADAASNWWVKPVMGLAGDAISIGTGLATGGASAAFGSLTPTQISASMGGPAQVPTTTSSLPNQI